MRDVKEAFLNRDALAAIIALTAGELAARASISAVLVGLGCIPSRAVAARM